MSSPELSVPDELLRATHDAAGRRRGHADRISRLFGGVALVMVGSGMAPIVALPAVAAAIYAGRVVFRSTPDALRRSFLVRTLGGVAAGLFGGALGASAVNEAQGSGIRTAVGVAVAIGGAVLAITASRMEIRDVASSAPTPGVALEITGLDFAYGTNQVLFDVSLTVREGEIAALLGTNGAGKSTILRAVAGLDPPIGGSIRVFGDDTTFTDAEEMVRRGVALLAGGRMTFPSLTVEENLRVGAYTVPTRARITEVYDRFPQLASRRQQRAGTLSGGEQQMLALGRVLLTEPRLVLIDELTLGLAPKVVEDLIEIVRDVNARGTTVLLVEQSANLAMSLAGHAFFLERGEVRFDGATAELLDRDDLLRPVFLGDAAS